MEERARELINPLDLSCQAQKDKIIKIFIKALEEQDLITRHACDESITNIKKPYAGMVGHVSIDDVHTAIMNVKAENMSPVKYGCHVDLFDDIDPDGCVIDSDRSLTDCFHAKPGMEKEDCEFWKPINTKKGTE